jgi:hypothetical protein
LLIFSDSTRLKIEFNDIFGSVSIKGDKQLYVRLILHIKGYTPLETCVSF